MHRDKHTHAELRYNGAGILLREIDLSISAHKIVCARECRNNAIPYTNFIVITSSLQTGVWVSGLYGGPLGGIRVQSRVVLTDLGESGLTAQLRTNLASQLKPLGEWTLRRTLGWDPRNI